MSSLKLLDKSISDTIRHQQIVLNVTSVVKELLENSIDAGCTHIDVCLKNYGLDSIEVSDNGSGIQEDDLVNFSMKSYTSKLATIEDLTHLNTFGFRGEAISSLCAMATLRCITRHQSGNHANNVTYDKQGVIIENVPTARDVGTTVVVSELFRGVPVRRRELEKNIRSDYSKVLRLLEAFAILNPRCSLSCFNWVNNNKTKGTLQKLSVLNVPKSDSLWERMKDIFGTQQLKDLSTISHTETLCLDDFSQNSSSSSKLTQQQLESSQVTITFQGYISSVNGKSSKFHKNSQYLYMNNRWCSHSKFTKVINQVYQQCSCSNRLPFLVLFITLPDEMVDVNVSTQKDIFIVKKEKQFLFSIKKYLEDLLGNQHSMVSSHVNPTIQMADEKCFQSKIAKIEDTTPLIHNIEIFTPLQRPIVEIDDVKKTIFTDPKIISSLENIEKRAYNNNNSKVGTTKKSGTHKEYIMTSFEDALIERKRHNKEISYDSDKFNKFCAQNLHVDFNDFFPTISNTQTTCDPILSHSTQTDDKQIVTNACFTSSVNIHNEIFAKKFHREWFKQMNIIGQFNHGFIIAEYAQALYVIDQHAADEKYNYERMKNNLKINSQQLLKAIPLKLTPFQFDQLTSYKDHLLKIGLDFQIDRECREAQLCAIPFINGSFLFNENEVIELLEQFTQSMYNIDGEVVSNNCAPYDKIVEGSTLYTKKINHIIASKACRSSIMIGKPLTHQSMKNIVDNLATLKQPWNCPHGRPTMRHLLNI